MGLFSNLFSKKNTATVQPQPVQMPEEKKPRYIVKSQRFILDNVKDHMEDIMEPCWEKRGLQIKKERPHRRKIGKMKTSTNMNWTKKQQ